MVTDSWLACHEFEPRSRTGWRPIVARSGHGHVLLAVWRVISSSLVLLKTRRSLVVMVTDSWLACHEFEPSTAEDP
ncbi:hypothetical protein TNCV_2876591 [Trichonephila clavipes]|nr:hypothetical protein TNCV_2876591 [Trichonephila clavipes]